MFPRELTQEQDMARFTSTKMLSFVIDGNHDAVDCQQSAPSLPLLLPQSITGYLNCFFSVGSDRRSQGSKRSNPWVFDASVCFSAFPFSVEFVFVWQDWERLGGGPQIYTHHFTL
jgi:hypothetical protein